MVDWTMTVPPERGQSLKNKLGLGEEWAFVPQTNGFVKSKPCPLPQALQELYERQNSHTR